MCLNQDRGLHIRRDCIIHMPVVFYIFCISIRCFVAADARAIAYKISGLRNNSAIFADLLPLAILVLHQCCGKNSEWKRVAAK